MLRHRYAVLVACCTFLLVIAGGLVTSTDSGLAVPDWPLSFGQVFPRMEGGVLFEHGHRMVAASVGFLTVILAVWTARAEQRAWVRRLGWIMLAAVIVQGLLGGLTVLMKLPDAVSVSHAGLAEIFFALTVVMATVTSPRWIGGTSRLAAQPPVRLALATAMAIYVQIILGAVVRHTGAALLIPDWPTSLGRIIPPLNSPLIAVNFAHRVGAALVAALVVVLVVRVFRRHRHEPWLTRPATALACLTLIQIGLGAATVLTRTAVTPTTAHVAAGALIWITSVTIALRAHRTPADSAVPAEAAPLAAAEPAVS